MKNVQKNKKAKSNDVAFGVISIILSFVASLVFIIAAVVNTIGALAFESTEFVGGMLILFGIAMPCIWICAGAKALIRAARSTAYAKIVDNYPRVKLSELAKSTGRSLKTVSADLNSMKKCGYFGDMAFDLENKELVFSEFAAPLPKLEGEEDSVYRECKGMPVFAVVTAVVTALAFSFLLFVILALIIGVVSLLLLLRFFPAPVFFIEEELRAVKEKKPSATGNTELDGMLKSIYENKNELARLSVSITEPKIREPLKEILRIIGEIVSYVSENPDKTRSLRQFASYYLPTTVNFLKTYEELQAKPDKGENIKNTMVKIEEITANITDVYRREYDDLFGDMAMDISAEAAVMQAIIKENSW